MRRLTFLIVLLLQWSPLAAREPTASLSYYLGDVSGYDTNVPKPADVLGYEVGEWHARHDQIVQYFEKLAATSPRLRLETYGYTYERRLLLLATVSSPQNLARLDEIRTQHLASLTPGGDAPSDPLPIIIWMGYSVHGNESSGSNAALLFAYHLAAARGPKIETTLANSVILIDPCINPDGLSRFAHWANTHRGKNLVTDPNHREHLEVWPRGRTNHYWFDLNRDWLLLTHPESRARLTKYHQWKPNVVTDFHEMGTNSTYFFQPGVPERRNPLTPVRNVELTDALGRFHAAALDRVGSLYYTEESFDDFYYGKGSTYPDINGAVGVLFEQASSRGHAQESSTGILSFPFTIRNQLLTSLSTIAGAIELRTSLQEYQREFYRDATALAAAHPVRAYLFAGEPDPARTWHFLDILRRHAIAVHRPAREIATEKGSFKASSSYIVPLNQPQFRLIRSLFETQTEFRDSTFYDVSTWTMPLAFGLRYAPLRELEYGDDLLGEVATAEMTAEMKAGKIVAGKTPYAYAFEWHGYYAPRALQRLFDAEVKVLVATKPFHAKTPSGDKSFDYGTILVPLGIQESEETTVVLENVAQKDGVDVYGLTTGLTPKGIDLGSPNMRHLKPPRPALVIGSGVSGYEAGEVWHLLDQRYDLPVSMLEARTLERVDLSRYTHLVFVSGTYTRLPTTVVDRIGTWVRGGGVLVGTGTSVVWMGEKFLATADQKAPVADKEAAKSKTSATPAPAVKRERYVDFESLRAKSLIRGAIFAARVDPTHPLGFGYDDTILPVFRNSTLRLPAPTDPFTAVVTYTQEPRLSGYATPENIEKLRGTSTVQATRVGAGAVIRMVDNPNFRGFWYGTNKLFANALYFGGMIKRTSGLGEAEH